jgi:hypothetical protein
MTRDDAISTPAAGQPAVDPDALMESFPLTASPERRP